MRYDPIMCMMVPGNGMRTKDESYIIAGRKYKVIERKGDNVRVLGPDGKVTNMHIDYMMTNGKRVNDNFVKNIDKAIRTADATTPLLNAIKRKDSELKKRAKQYIQELKTIKDKKEFETKKRKYYLEIKSEARDWHDAFNKEANEAMSAASKLEDNIDLIEYIEFNG